MDSPTSRLLLQPFIEVVWLAELYVQPTTTVVIGYQVHSVNLPTVLGIVVLSNVGLMCFSMPTQLT
jgi:hypothetical protein